MRDCKENDELIMKIEKRLKKHYKRQEDSLTCWAEFMLKGNIESLEWVLKQLKGNL